MKFFKCEHCGNIVTYLKNSGVPVICCGEKMQEIVAGVVDASKEKHVPVAQIEGNKVTVLVGSVEHPMIEAHYIEWICVVTKQGVQIKYLQPGQKPEASFALCEDDAFVEVYEYCNLHGLWKA